MPLPKKRAMLGVANAAAGEVGRLICRSMGSSSSRRRRRRYRACLQRLQQHGQLLMVLVVVMWERVGLELPLTAARSLTFHPQLQQ